jgi:uncharacterized protein (DUF2141 family)
MLTTTSACGSNAYDISRRRVVSLGIKGADSIVMRRRSFVILVVLAAVLSLAPVRSAPETSTVTVTITGFRNDKGRVDGLIFSGPQGFPEEDARAFDKQEAEIDPKTLSAQLVFRNVPRGYAAVSILHDENMNRRIDKNFIGIPKEGYGTSNNPRKAKHTPRWDEGRFLVDKPEEAIVIRLIYW